MNMWVKPGISVGCIVLSCIISAVASSGATSSITVEAGTSSPESVENIATYNRMLQGVETADERIVRLIGSSSSGTDLANMDVKSYTLTETSSVGISYSVKSFGSSYSVESMATRKLSLAVTEYEWYCTSEIISLYNNRNKSLSMDTSLSMDISSEIYISLTDKVCYINIHKFNVLKEGYSTSAPTDVLDKWFSLGIGALDNIIESEGNTEDSGEILIYYVLSSYIGSAQKRIMSAFGSLSGTGEVVVNTEQFAVNGKDYILKDSNMSTYATELSGFSVPSKADVSGKLSISLEDSSAPVTTVNYNCRYTGSSESLNIYENDKLTYTNVNNTVIQGVYMGGAMTLSDYMNYWGDTLK